MSETERAAQAIVALGSRWEERAADLLDGTDEDPVGTLIASVLEAMALGAGHLAGRIMAAAVTEEHEGDMKALLNKMFGTPQE